MNFKKIARQVLAMTVLTSIALVGCGGEPKTTTGEGASNTTSNKSQSLIIYSNSVADGRGEWLKEKAKEEGFDIEYVDAGGGEIANRLIAEKNSPIADIVFGLNTMNYEQFKEEDLLEQYVPVWAGEVTEGLNDPEGYYHALVKQAIVLVYNADLYTKETAPQDWPDLWNNEAFRGLYQVQTGLGGSTVRNVIAGILVRYQDPNGELGISEEGWKEIGKFFSYGTPAVQGEDLYVSLANETNHFGQMWSSGIADREKQYGVNTDMVNPEVGVPYAVEQIAIVKGTKKLETAKAFVDWFGSEEVQGEWAQEFSTMPANEGAMALASEEARFVSENYKPQMIDWKFVAQNMEDWCEKIELQYMQ